jgi:hypothetical protein
MEAPEEVESSFVVCCTTITVGRYSCSSGMVGGLELPAKIPFAILSAILLS